MGRPTKLNPEDQETVLEIIRVGGYRSDAAAAIGIAEHTFIAWMERGKTEGREPYYSFRKEVLKAENFAKMRAIKAFTGAFDNDWKAAKTYLGIKHSNQWSEIQKHEVNVEAKDVLRAFTAALGGNESFRQLPKIEDLDGEDGDT